MRARHPKRAPAGRYSSRHIHCDTLVSQVVAFSQRRSLRDAESRARSGAWIVLPVDTVRSKRKSDGTSRGEAGVPGSEGLAARRAIFDKNGTGLENQRLIGIAADHGGFELKQYLVAALHEAGCQVIDFGSKDLEPDDDYPDYVLPLAHSVARGEVFRGVAICGSGVGACVAANKLAGVRACLLHDTFSAHQGVEDDDLNLICLGGLVVGRALAWELVQSFLAARFTGADRHRRRLAKVAEVENRVAAEPSWPGSVKVLGGRLASRIQR